MTNQNRALWEAERRVAVVELDPGDRMRVQFLGAARNAFRFRLLGPVPTGFHEAWLKAGEEISISATRFHGCRIGPAGERGEIVVDAHCLPGGWTSARFVPVPIQDREEEFEAGDW